VGSASGRETSDIDGDDGTAPAGGGLPRRRPRPRWLVRHVRLLALLDATAAAAATFLAKLIIFGFEPADLSVRSVEVPYVALAFVSVPAWLIVLTTSRCYDLGPLGDSNGEVRRVVSAAAHFVALMAVAYYLVRIQQLGRDFLVVIVPLATGLTLAFRAVARWQLRLLRLRNHAVRKAAVMGSRAGVGRLLDHLASHPGSGIEPVAALVPSSEADLDLPRPVLHGDTWEVPVVAAPDDVVAGLNRTDADLLVVAGGYEPGHLRHLTWGLEGTGVDVMVAPTGAHPTGLDLDVRPVAGLPLLYVSNGVDGEGP
jgi:FlaA1/EpsC-like NDP-sugar epimerase